MINLKYLSLTRNEIQTWEDIENLWYYCPDLETLNISDNPFIESLNGHSQQAIVARFPNLVRLNSSSITPAERLDSERRYLAIISRTALGKTEEEIQVRNPQWRALCDKHGRPSVGELRPDVAKNLRNRLISIIIWQVDQNPLDDLTGNIKSRGKHSAQVLPTMSLAAIRKKISRVLAVPPNSSMDLWIKLEHDKVTTLVPLTQTASQDLAAAGIVDGTTLVAYVEPTPE